MGSKEWDVAISKRTGAIRRLTGLVPTRLDIQPDPEGFRSGQHPGGSGMVLFMENMNQKRRGCFTTVASKTVATGKSAAKRWVRLSMGLEFPQAEWHSLAGAAVCYTLFDDRFDVALRIRYRRTDTDVYRLGVRHLVSLSQWSRQLYPDRRTLSPDDSLYLMYGWLGPSRDATPSPRDCYGYHFPIGILERSDRYVLWGSRDLGISTFIAPNAIAKGYIPSFITTPKGIRAGQEFAIAYTFKSFPRPRLGYIDLLRWYASHTYSTDPLTRGLATYVDHRPRTWFGPGQERGRTPHFRQFIMLYEGDVPPGEKGTGRYPDQFEVGEIFDKPGCPVGERTEPYLTWMSAYEDGRRLDYGQVDTLTTDRKGERLPYPWKEIAVYADFGNEEYLRWYLNKMKRRIDRAAREGINSIFFDYCWGFAGNLPSKARPGAMYHGYLRSQREIWQWVKRKHPEMKIRINDGIANPSQWYADAVTLEGNRLDLVYLSGKAFRTTLQAILYRNDFGKGGNDWSVPLKTVARGALIGHSDVPMGAELAQFCARANGIPLVGETHILKMTPEDPALLASVWADATNLLAAAYNDREDARQISLQFNKRILADYGQTSRLVLSPTLFQRNGKTRADSTFKQTLASDGCIVASGDLGGYEAVLLASREGT